MGLRDDRFAFLRTSERVLDFFFFGMFWVVDYRVDKKIFAWRIRKSIPGMEFWYDSNHTGALRVVDKEASLIHGSDPNEKNWTAEFRTSHNSMFVDFSKKRTHRGALQMEAVYRKNRNELHWPDGNVWKRMRVDPRILLRRM